jgi:hypothetical protein
VNADTLQKVTADSAALKDLLSKDDGSADLIDAQFLLFNLVAIVWFLGALIADPSNLPVIPAGLVGLTSVSALTYTASKAAASNAPVVRSVTRRLTPGAATSSGDGIRASDLVDIRGLNFIPPGADTSLANLRVRFGTIDVVPEVSSSDAADRSQNVSTTYPTDAFIVAQVPAAGLTAGQPVAVKVLSAGGVESNEIMVMLDVDTPTITGIRPSVAAANNSVTISGRYLRMATAEPTQAALPTVFFGDQPTRADAWVDDGTAVTARVPEGAGPGDISVKVRANGSVSFSDSVPLTVLDG